MELPTANTSYHTAPEESTEIDPNNFIMQQPSNEMGPPIAQLLKTTPPGSQENPIDVDKLPARRRNDTPSPTVGILYRRGSEPSHYACSRCEQTGHTSQHCIWTGPIICSNCGRPGHVKKDCKEHPLCSFCRSRHPIERKPCDRDILWQSRIGPKHCVDLSQVEKTRGAGKGFIAVWDTEKLTGG